MNNEEIRKKGEIESALATIAVGDFLETSKELLAVLGYRSERTARLPGTADDFIQRFPARNKNTETEQEFLNNAESVELVFQVRSEEIAPSDQPTLFESPAFDKGYVRSFMFFAIELKDPDYPRGKYAQFTREVNKRFIMPIVVFFRVENRLTIGFVGRRQDKRDPNLDVLEQVTLIKDIRLDKPHRAHTDILFELSLAECAKWMNANKQPEDFDGLLAAWLARLDTSELNKRFFNELANWYFWAVDEVTFPDDAGEDVEVRNATSVIRLLTRLIFVWFIKEKGLVPDALFNPRDLDGILNNLDPQESTYYKAVLQNLFFATLNQEMNTAQKPDNRKFRGERRQHYNITSLYRYKDCFIDPDDVLRKFEEIPFLNGGLFECLDAPSKEDATRILRVDGFSDRNDNPLHVPNELFFSDERTVDLNAAYGTRGKRHKVRGLIHILSSYKFTIAENTPIEEEVALDPELLGKVFENLLAAYNPETEATARKQTGSYYTPREIVNYMTDESLIAYLKNELITHSEAQRSFSVTTPPSQLNLAGQADPVQTELDVETVSLSDEQKAEIEQKLRELFVYNDEPNPFDKADTEVLIRAIDTLKILDPAVGSGAFPMGGLHKLVFILGKLDPGNMQWKDRQIDRASTIPDPIARDNAIDDIEAAFERNELNYGRKLYLIENCIYGVDIQPIATQIAKLRFFISLIVDQQIDDSPDNRGVRPLPNLETKFVAANTLIGLDRPLQMQIRNPQIDRKEKELEDVRRRHFTARTPKTKAKYRALDAQIRAEISELLEGIGFPHETTEKIAHWDPYNQNANADWFDPEWMFGITDGFDVVIGNPPYIQLQKNAGELGSLYKDIGYATFVRTGDIYQLFCEKGCQLLKPRCGLLVYITSNSWLKAQYGQALRRYFSEQHTPLRLLEMGEDIFENAIVDTSILLLREGNSNTVRSVIAAVDMDKLNIKDFPPQTNLWGQVRLDDEKPWSILSYAEHGVMDKMKAKGTPLKDWDVAIYRGVLTGYNKAFLIDNDAKDALIAEDPNSAKIIKPILRGRDIQRYWAKWAGLWLIDTHNGYDDVPAVNIDNYPAIKSHLNGFYPRLEKRQDKGRTPYNLRNCAYYEDFAKEKLFWIELVENGRFAYDDSGIYGEATSFIMTGECVKYLCAVLNGELARWFLQQVAPTSGMGTLRWKKVYVETIPVPKISAVKQQPLIQLVDCILDAKATDPDADVCELEKKIDQIVYSLYDLTCKEIAIVEGAENI